MQPECLTNSIVCTILIRGDVVVRVSGKEAAFILLSFSGFCIAIQSG